MILYTKITLAGVLMVNKGVRKNSYRILVIPQSYSKAIDLHKNKRI